MDGSRGWAVVLRRRRRVTLLSVLAVVTAVAAALLAGGLVGPAPRTARADTVEAPDPGPPAAYRLGSSATSRTLLHYRGRIADRTVADSSEARNHGRAAGGIDGRIVSVRSGQDERFLRFPGRPCTRERGCPRALVVPADEPPAAWAGARGPFSFGAWVRLTQAPGDAGMTVLQRGGGAERGAPQWSLHVDDGRVSCRWSDGARTAVLPDDLGRSVALDLRRWYALSCAARGEHVTLTVTDAMTSLPVATFAETVTGLGPILAEGPVTIGATPRDGSTLRVTGQFRGDLDEVMVRTG